MTNVKKEVLEGLENLSNNVDVDKAMYFLYFYKKVLAGIKDEEEGNIMTLEEARERRKIKHDSRNYETCG